jgi:hypothetical protein
MLKKEVDTLSFFGKDGRCIIFFCIFECYYIK